MPDWSRRHALQATGGALLTALAGCNGTDSASGSYPGENRTAVEDAVVLKVRNTTPTPMVVRERDSGDGEPTTEPAETTDAPPRHRGRIMAHVTDMDRDGLSPTFPADVAGADRFAAFFDETDFDTESIYLEQSPVPECYVRHLTGVYREPDGVEADFCRKVRPADVSCAADAYDMTAFAIRLPFAGDDFNSVGASHGSGCRRPRGDLIEPDQNHVVGPTDSGSSSDTNGGPSA